ncbi:MAG TPA: nucleotidyl transferase [Anaerolineae bacterium]|nr:NTP transferase domain-containing protein [Caldilineae bacterium]HID34493.1 nucleotidyl transferase [Anaerolineae bacterium]
MKAIVMAGGQGSRLRPLTTSRPKPLIPLVNKPMVAHIIDWLRRHQITEVVLTLQHQADWFQGYLGTGMGMGVQIAYAVEESPLGTAGGVRNTIEQGLVDFDETVIVVSGDAVTDFDLRALVDFHEAEGAEVTVALHRVENPLEYGMVITEADGRIVQFVEKPGWAEVVSDLVNTGIYVLRAEVLREAPAGEAYDFSNDLFPRLLAEGRPLFGLPMPGYWTDAGSPPEYMQASFDMLQGRVWHKPFGEERMEGVWVGENVIIHDSARVRGPVFLGDNVRIKADVVLEGPAVIRDDTVVDARARISRSILWRGCYVGEGAELNGAIVSKQCVIKRHARIHQGVVIGDKTIIGESAVIHPNVKIWPEKEVEAGAEVRESIIWAGQRGRRALFGRFGVTGVVNVDLTPEFAAKLGVAFGASLPKGSMVTINRDRHPGSRMLKRAIISGLPAAGVQVLDLRTQPIPVARYYTRVSDAEAGVHVRISPHDRQVVDIRFINAQGINLGRKKEREVERLFFREDFRRVQVDEIGRIGYATEVEGRYARYFLQNLDVKAIQDRAFSVAVDYAHGSTVEVLEPLLESVHVDVVSLNARPEYIMLSTTPDEWEALLQRLGKLTATMGLDLGAMLDVGGEKLYLVDDKGWRIPDMLAAALMADLMWRVHPGCSIAVPVDAPTVFEAIAERYGGRVVRTRVDVQALMVEAAAQNVALALNGNGHFIFACFHPAPDGMFALTKLLEFLATRRIALSQATANLPPFHRVHATIHCPLAEKGRIMREVNEGVAPYILDTIDGVRFSAGEGRWVLIRPDADRPLLHIVAQGRSAEDAESLVGQQIAWVADLISMD